MKTQSVKAQSFGRIIAPDKYIVQQLAKIKGTKRKSIVEKLLNIVKESDAFDMYVKREGKITLKFRKPYSTAIKRNTYDVDVVPHENTFINALIVGTINDSIHNFYKRLYGGFLGGLFKPYEYGFRAAEAKRKYKVLDDVKKYGRDLVKI